MPKHRRGRHGPQFRAVVVGGVVLGVVLGGSLIAAAAVPLPTGPPQLVLHVAATPPPMRPLDLPFAAHGESAVGIPSLGVALTPGSQASVPIASLTKLMTTYVALKELPLTPTEQGPSITVTADDVKTYKQELRADNSVVLVAAGETLTERELLDGMLVHSANNFALLLGRMVAGDDDQMVNEMNAEAGELGLTKTSYADVTGLNPESRSDAANLLRLSTLLMRNPTFTTIVAQTSVVLPVAGVVTTFTPYLGTPGVVGIKTGTTTAAGGCVILAYDAKVGGRVVQVISVVLGQPASSVSALLAVSGRAAYTLAIHTARRIRAWRVVDASVPVGTIGWPSISVPVVALRSISVPVFPGVAARSTVTLRTWSASYVAAGQRLATVTVVSGRYRFATPLVAATALTRASLWQRLT